MGEEGTTDGERVNVGNVGKGMNVLIRFVTDPYLP